MPNYLNPLFYSPADLIQNVYLNPAKGWFSVIKPIARTNLVANPSGELSVADYWNMTITLNATRDSTQQYYGAYSISRNLTAIGDGIRYVQTVPAALTLTSGTIYAVSLRVLCLQAGIKFTAGVYPSGGSVSALVTREWKTTGRWQWVSVIWKETATLAREFAIRLTSSPKPGGSTFFTDGWQVEACNATEVFPTTYIDGDQTSLLVGQFPAPYGWTGARHASTSYRTAQTRDGGQVINLDQLNFSLTDINGLGAAPRTHVIAVRPLTDGADYGTTYLSPRQFVLRGRLNGQTDLELDQYRNRLSDALNVDSTYPRQPVALLYRRYADLDPVSDEGKIIATYDKGLENGAAHMSEDVPLQFTQWFPMIRANDQGQAMTLSTDVSITNFTSLLFRDKNGAWSQIASSGGSADIRHIQRHFDGTYYICGLFTTLGVAANRIVRYNPETNTFTALGTGLNGTALRLRIGSDGDVFVCGSFTTAGGVTVNRVARWDTVALTWNALGAGATKGVDDTAFDMAIDAVGDVYIAGQFLNAGGSAANRVVKWVKSTNAFQTLGTGMNGTAISAATALDGLKIYFGGQFTTSNTVVTNGAARWNGTTFDALGAGIDPGGATFAQSLAVGPDGSLYAIGTFLASGGAPGNYIARWTGSNWVTLGSGLSNPGTDLAFGFDGLLYLTGVAWTTINGSTPITDGSAQWNGSTYLLPDIDMPDSPTGRGPTTGPLGELMIGFGTATGAGTGTAKAAAINTLTNTGTLQTYPTFYISGPSVGTAQLYNLRSYTTGEILSFNLTILEAENITITMKPGSTRVISATRGDITQSALVGSSGQLTLIKGTNKIAALVVGTNLPTMNVKWPRQFGATEELLYT